MSRVVTFAVVVSVATGALAANIPITPKKLIVVDKSVAGNAKVVFVAKDDAVTKGAGEDVEQIDVRFDVTYGNGSAAGAFVVPAGTGNGWVVNNSTVAKYVNKAAPEGPTEAKVVVIKPTKLLKLVGKGLGDVDFNILSAGDPGGPVSTAFCVTNGGEKNCHCSEFTGCVWKPIGAGSGAKLVCKTGTGDAACSAHCLTDTGLTVIDTCNNLEWEKKDTVVGSGVDAGNLHDVDNRYSWAGQCTLNTSVYCQPNAAAAATCTAQTGGAVGCGQCGVGDGTCDVDPIALGAITTIWDWVNEVNAASFAGHMDWRLPTMGGDGMHPTGEPAELESIVDLGFSPTIDPIFGPTVANDYSSASGYSPNLAHAWAVYFGDGEVDGPGKSVGIWVRAVRPGS